MQRPNFRHVALAAALLLTPVAVLTAGVHNRLVKAEPGVDSTVTVRPAEIQLWFAQKPEAAVSTIRLRSASDTTKQFATGAVTAGSDAKAIKAAVTDSLAPGTYTVLYRTASDDGHAIRGRYSFTLK